MIEGAQRDLAVDRRVHPADLGEPRGLCDRDLLLAEADREIRVDRLLVADRRVDVEAVDRRIRRRRALHDVRRAAPLDDGRRQVGEARVAREAGAAEPGRSPLVAARAGDSGRRGRVAPACSSRRSRRARRRRLREARRARGSSCGRACTIDGPINASALSGGAAPASCSHQPELPSGLASGLGLPAVAGASAPRVTPPHLPPRVGAGDSITVTRLRAASRPEPGRARSRRSRRAPCSCSPSRAGSAARPACRA